jgi:hypothetical protein
MKPNFMWPRGTQVIVLTYNNNKGIIINLIDHDLYEIQIHNGPTIVTTSQSLQIIDYPSISLDIGEKPFLRMNELISGGLYEIDARNASLGIWIYDQLGFLIRRQKMGDIFLFVEYHYESGSPFGTVRPYVFIEKCPFIMEALQIQGGYIDYKYADIILEYLKRKDKEYEQKK